MASIFDFDDGQAAFDKPDPDSGGEIPIAIYLGEDDSQELIDDEEQAHNSSVVAGDLMDIYNDLNNADEDGHAVTVYNATAAAIEAIGKSMKSNTKLVRMEAHDGRIRKKQIFQTALEDVGDMIIAAIKKIIEWVKKAARYMYELFQKSRTGSSGLVARAKRIGAEAKDAALKKKKESEGIANTSVIKFFSHDGNLMEAHEIENAYKRYMQEIGGTYSSDMVDKAANAILPLIPKITDAPDREEIVSAIDPAITDIRSHLLKSFKEGHLDKNSDDKHHIISYQLPFNGDSIVCMIQIEDSKQTSMRIIKHEDTSPSQHKTIEVLTPDEIGQLAKLVEEEAAFGIYQQHDKITKAMNKIENSISRATDNVMRAVKKKPDEAKKEMFSMEFLRSTFAALSNYVAIFYKYDTLCAVRILDYCEASVKHYV